MTNTPHIPRSRSAVFGSGVFSGSFALPVPGCGVSRDVLLSRAVAVSDARACRPAGDIHLRLPPGEIVILVTHYVNIRALTGRSVASGEVILLEIGRDGMISVVDEILIDPSAE